MRRLTALFAAVSLSAAGLVAFAGTAPAQPDPVGRLFGLSHRPVCPVAPQGTVRCNADVVVDDSGKPLATTGYQNGYAPADLASAYGTTLPAYGAPWSWNGETVAIVDAYSNPNDVSDLAAYRSQFGLPACTVASGCFTEVNENGQASPLPAGNASWGDEISLDLDMVSANCPMCKILMVDGSSTSLSDLGTAVNAAASLGANAVSNSYGTSGEFSSEASYGDTYYNNHPGIAITASSGDSGYGVEFPAVSRNVTAVGGTHLTQSNGTWSETVWNGTGSGCSAYIGQQGWQTTLFKAQGLTGCSKRVVGDVAAVADPNTGVAVYDSYGSTGGANWYVYGGTSVASPIIASFYALADAAHGPTVNDGSLPYSHAGSLNDVTSGSNGRCTSRRSTGTGWLCTARAGYDGPTGMGTPRGTGAF